MTEIVGLTNASVQNPIVDGITASTTQTEGNGQLTKAVNVVSTVANTNDTVTLPVLTKGMSCTVINTGANTLKVYAGSSGTIDGKAAGTPVYILPKGSQTFWRYGTTPPTWMSVNYVREIMAAKGDTGAATVTLDLEIATVFTAKATGNVTWVFSNPAPSGQASTLTLILQNGEAFTMTWPGAVKWPGGTKPTLTASGYDVLTFITVDGGTTWRGALNQKDSK